MRLILLALLLPAAATAQTSIDGNGIRTRRGGGTTIDGNNGQRSINCNGGALSVTGNGNNISAAGCTRISVEGNGNTLLARFGRNGTVRLTGNRNHLAWSVARDARVAIADLGNANSTARR